MLAFFCIYEHLCEIVSYCIKNTSIDLRCFFEQSNRHTHNFNFLKIHPSIKAASLSKATVIRTTSTVIQLNSIYIITSHT